MSPVSLVPCVNSTHAASHAPHLAQPGHRVLPVMNGTKSYRGVEGLVLEREAFCGSSVIDLLARSAASTAADDSR
jgi:hypothetical protein